MKIAYYCQHVLGIGHFHRSLEICNQLAVAHQVNLILGGPDVKVDNHQIDVIQLPGLEMDSEFKNLKPCNDSRNLDDVKAERQHLLYNWFETHRPDIFIVELYPFGRKAFRFELDPVLRAIRSDTLNECKCYVSLRDILVERPDDKQKFEERVVKTLNRYFDALLIHADETFITLNETFSRMDDIEIPVAYTGFITKKSQSSDPGNLRQELQVGESEQLIVASIGGGNVGKELLFAVTEACRLLNDPRLKFLIFTGPYFPEKDYSELEKKISTNARLARFSDRFPALLAAADLSISMAGYNTSMNVMDAGVPALLYPFKQNREQQFRAERLQRFGSIRLIEISELKPEKLAELIRQQLTQKRYIPPIKLDGAETTRILVEKGVC